MEDGFNIYIERLREGHIEEISESFSSDFLNESPNEYRFEKPIQVTGQAYLAGDQLVIHLTLEAIVLIPCRICNEFTPLDIKVQEMYDGIPVESIKSGVYCIRQLIQEAMMLQLPEFYECHQGNCPEREKLKKYLKAKPSKDNDDLEGYQPFKELKLD